MDALRRELASCLGQESDIITSSTAVPPTAAALDCTLLLRNVTLPSAALLDSNLCEHLPSGDDEGNLLADVLIAKGKINRIAAPGAANAIEASTVPVRTVDLARKMLWPCFCDPHAHLMKVHGCPRCPNPTGSITDAMACEASDRPWSHEDLRRRAEFALRSAYHHGSRLIRTHLDGSEDDRPDQRTAVWAVFDELRAAWDGKVQLQGVANLYLPLWSVSELAQMQVTEAVSRKPNVVLGAYCGCIRDRSLLPHLQELFRLAHAHDLPVDLHVDETNSPHACGMLLAMEALAEVRAAGYQAPVLCGHCCAVSLMPSAAQKDVVRLAQEAEKVFVVANPLTNAWLQDRRGTGDASGEPIPEEQPRTPQWRGLTLVQEFQAAGVAVALGGDNVRDWWFNYGDSDPLEVFRVGVLLGHLDKPHGSLANWAGASSRVPAAALGNAFCRSNLDGKEGLGLGEGFNADLLIFGARSFSELLARPQADRIVLRSNGMTVRVVGTGLPDYAELDDLVATRTQIHRSSVLPGRD